MNDEIVNKLPRDARFKIIKVEDIVIPHPYMITEKHLANNETMVLNIAEAERRSKEKHPNDKRKWAVCEICRVRVRKGLQSEVLTYDEHKIQKILFLGVEQNKDLNNVDGLREYLIQIKPILEELKVDGVAFVNKVENN